MKSRRVASRQTPYFFASAKKSMQKWLFSFGGHLFRGLLCDLLIFED
jgi:hypothetical protein